MNNKNYQTKMWSGEFGTKYTRRNTFSYIKWNKMYKDRFGYTKENINKSFLYNLPKKIKILELGCNIGSQLRCLYKMGYKNLNGIEIQHHCLKKLKKNFNFVNGIQSTIFKLPFNNNSFDLVFTNNVLIHIPPKKIHIVLKEMYRVSKLWIWGSEYYSQNYKEIIYRKNKNLLWKADFAKIFLRNFKNLKIVKHKFLVSKFDNKEIDSMYLLKKK